MNKLNFSLTQLEYVLAVHKYGHFAKAAENCFVTQPTLSMQIQKLEESLGTVIFDRSKKPILLTAQGQKLVEQMQAIVQQAKKLETIIEEEKSGILSGNLIIGVIPTLAPYILPKLLPNIKKMYPEISLTIFEMQTHKIIEALNDDSIDVGLLATPLGSAQINERPLFWEPFSLLCRNDHALSKAKSIKYSTISAEEVWLLEEGHCLRNQVLDVCSNKRKTNTKRQFQFESGSLETLKRLVDSYGGYTLLPYLAQESLGKNVKLIPFERPIPARQIGLVTRRDQYKAALLQALESALLKGVPEVLLNIKEKDLDVLPVKD
jgi:LysR family transcriptional regulator, hydrogen peroxide-inducible genes activator